MHQPLCMPRAENRRLEAHKRKTRVSGSEEDKHERDNSKKRVRAAGDPRDRPQEDKPGAGPHGSSADQEEEEFRTERHPVPGLRRRRILRGRSDGWGGAALLYAGGTNLKEGGEADAAKI